MTIQELIEILQQFDPSMRPIIGVDVYRMFRIHSVTEHTTYDDEGATTVPLIWIGEEI